MSDAHGEDVVARLTEFTHTVTVVDSGGNKYAINGNTQQYVILFPGSTYKFDQADSTNNGQSFTFFRNIKRHT